MASVDWDKGLPTDALALVAKAGGTSLMMEMRGVSTTWKAGYELAVTSITVRDGDPLDPLLPLGPEAAHRFPSLTMLDLGGSTFDTAWLANLRDYPNLACLTLGGTQPDYSNEDSLVFRLADADMLHLQAR